jgi:hypothetical protein
MIGRRKPGEIMPLLDFQHLPNQRSRSWEGFHCMWAVWITHELNTRHLPDRYFAEPLTQTGMEVEAEVLTFEELDVFEVRVYDSEGTRDLVAAVELVSPGNKDRASKRRQFATKCAAYLQNNVSFVMVDPITERRVNMHEEIMRRINLGDHFARVVTTPLYALAYRTAGSRESVRMEVWSEALAIGAPLPTLPLWIAPDRAVPLGLETSYNAACSSLKIRL